MYHTTHWKSYCRYIGNGRFIVFPRLLQLITTSTSSEMNSSSNLTQFDACTSVSNSLNQCASDEVILYTCICTCSIMNIGRQYNEVEADHQLLIEFLLQAGEITFFDLMDKQDVITVSLSGCIDTLLLAHHTDSATHLLVRAHKSSLESVCAGLLFLFKSLGLFDHGF